MNITRKEIEVKRRCGNGYRTLISNGKSHYIIDTCFTFDNGNESMVFSCDDTGENIYWEDLDSEDGFTSSEMKNEHEKMVERWMKKLEENNA